MRRKQFLSLPILRRRQSFHCLAWLVGLGEEIKRVVELMFCENMVLKSEGGGAGGRGLSLVE
jgi:hypothetical protein